MWQLLWDLCHSSSQLLWSQSSSSQRLTQMTAKFATDSPASFPSYGFDFVWNKTFKKLRLSLPIMGLLVKLWDLSKSSPNRRLSEKVGVAKWFCKEFEFGELGLFWVGNKVVNSCLGGRSSDKARKWQTVSLLLLDDTLGLAEMPTHSGEHQQKQGRWFSYQTLMCTDYDLEYLLLTKTICKTGIPWSKHKCLVTKTGLMTKLWSPILFS